MGGGAGECIGCASPGGSGGDGNVMIYHYSSPPLALPLKLDYYPFKLFTRSNASDVNFTLEQQYDGGTPAVLQSNMLNISYVPPETQAAGFYNFTLIERSPGAQNTLYSNLHVNMTDMNGELTFNSPTLQYDPNLAYFPYNSNTFTATPTSWKIMSDVAFNTHSNFTGTAYNEEQFSNKNSSYAPNIILSYGQFSPAISFSVNALNNPLMQTAIGLSVCGFVASNSLPSSPCTREIANITTYNQSSKVKLIANSSMTFTASLNNYTINIGSGVAWTANNFQVYTSLSNYQNPPITLINQTLISTASGFEPQQNNFFDAVYNSSTYANLHAYLPFAISSSSYAVTAFGCNGYAGGDYIQVMLFGNPTQQVQQYKMPSQMPFQLYLLNGYSYQFIITSPSKQTLFTSPFSNWISPLTFTAGCNSTVPLVPIANITWGCTWQNHAGNTLLATCSGKNTNNQVNSWNIQWVNQTTLITKKVLNTTVITGSSFSVSYLFSSNKSNNFYAYLTAYSGDPVPLLTTVHLNPIVLGPVTAFGFFFLLALLLLAFVLAWFDHVLYIIMLDASIIVAQLMGISPFSIDDIGFLAVGSITLITLAIVKESFMQPR